MATNRKLLNETNVGDAILAAANCVHLKPRRFDVVVCAPDDRRVDKPSGQRPARPAKILLAVPLRRAVFPSSVICPMALAGALCARLHALPWVPSPLHMGHAFEVQPGFLRHAILDRLPSDAERINGTKPGRSRE